MMSAVAISKTSLQGIPTESSMTSPNLLPPLHLSPSVLVSETPSRNSFSWRKNTETFPCVKSNKGGFWDNSDSLEVGKYREQSLKEN